MIAIARKRKQNSAYTTIGEARPGNRIRASTLPLIDAANSLAQDIFGLPT
jgi:hypothetical protein